MACFLFNDIVFGPVISRRLGISLGINLLPLNKKVCTFDCIYCECGWTLPDSLDFKSFHKSEDVAAALKSKLEIIKAQGVKLDNITFAGNGEPTMHPHFAEIIDNVVALRDTYYPQVSISVLSNATTLSDNNVKAALKKIDKPILKLDAGDKRLINLINRPLVEIDPDKIIENLINSKIDNVIIQSMFLKGHHAGNSIDNTTEEAVNKWLEALKAINPIAVMIYSIARETPAQDLIKIGTEELEAIAKKARALGFSVSAY